MEKLRDVLNEDYFANPWLSPVLIKTGVDNDVYSYFTLHGEQKIARLGHRSDGDDVNLEALLLQRLSQKDVPVSRIYLSKSGKTNVPLEGSTVTCFDYVEHDPITSTDTYVLSGVAGAMLSRMHLASSKMDFDFSAKRTIRSELERVTANRQKIVDRFKSGLRLVEAADEALNASLGIHGVQSVIHNDYNKSNVLFRKQQAVCIIDFDLSCNGPLSVDIAHGAMSWSTRSRIVKPDRRIFENFVSGYNELSPVPIMIDRTLFYWAAYCCLSVACDLACDSLTDNKFGITDINDSWMFKRYLYYRYLCN